MREKRIIQKGLKILLVSLLLGMLFGMTSMAAGSATVRMKLKQKGVYTSSGSYSNYTDIYNKIVLKKPSEIAVTGNCLYTNINTYGSLRVTLLNSKKKPLESGYKFVDAQNKKYAIYGVSAGTYYIKVTSEKNFALVVGVQYTGDAGGSTKARAATLPKNKNVKGLMRIGESAAKSDWYKFGVTQSKVLQLTINAESGGYFDFYLYGPSYSKGIKICTHKDTGGVYYSVRLGTTTKMKIKTGTYYIKVARASYDPKGSGIYQLKWNLY